MNFFKSILLDEPDPPKPETPHEPGPNASLKEHVEDRDPNDVAQDGNAGGWSFGGLIKTLATRSESVIETYRRDLEEFGSGLRKESEIIRVAASRAVKDLPASLEAGTSAAHGVLDGVLKSTAEIIKETQAFASDGEQEAPETNRGTSGRYSWFEAQLGVIQSDLNTFCEDPEDVEEFKKWKSSFELDGKRDEIDDLIGENGTLEGVYKRVVPSSINQETFWCRYFYRVDKLKQQEAVRANLVKRAIAVNDDEDELSWDVDDDEEEKDGCGSARMSNVKVKGGDGAVEGLVSDGNLNPVEIAESSKSNDGPRVETKGGNANVDDGDKTSVESIRNSSGNPSLDEKEVKSDQVVGVKSDEKVKPEESLSEKKNNENVGIEKSTSDGKSGEKVKYEESVNEKKNKENAGTEKSKSDEKSDAPLGSNHQPKEVEDDVDMEWDEIEDIGSGDEKKIPTATHVGRPNRAELRKKLNAAEDDEDLSWDIEDD